MHSLETLKRLNDEMVDDFQEAGKEKKLLLNIQIDIRIDIPKPAKKEIRRP